MAEVLPILFSYSFFVFVASFFESNLIEDRKIYKRKRDLRLHQKWLIRSGWFGLLVFILSLIGLIATKQFS